MFSRFQLERRSSYTHIMTQTMDTWTTLTRFFTRQSFWQSSLTWGTMSNVFDWVTTSHLGLQGAPSLQGHFWWKTCYLYIQLSKPRPPLEKYSLRTTTYCVGKYFICILFIFLSVQTNVRDKYTKKKRKWRQFFKSGLIRCTSFASIFSCLFDRKCVIFTSNCQARPPYLENMSPNDLLYFPITFPQHSVHQPLPQAVCPLCWLWGSLLCFLIFLVFVVSDHTATILLYFLLLFPRGILVFYPEAWLLEIVLDKNYTSSLVDNPDNWI